MSATMKVRVQDSTWVDPFDVDDLKKLLSYVKNLPNDQAQHYLKPRFLRGFLEARPRSLESTTEDYEMKNSSAASRLDAARGAILWDNDGVLVDSESAFFDLTRRVFRSHHLELEPARWARQFLGEGKHTWQIAFELGLPEDDARRLATQRDILWRQRLKEPVDLCAGVTDTLRKLSKKFRMAVVTGAPRDHFEDIHRFTGLLRFFEGTITSDDCSKVKPAPDAYLLAANRLGIHPSDCIAVEDSPRGVRAALAAGMRCILVKTALTDLSLCEEATWVVDSVSEIEEILAESCVPNLR